MSCLDVIGFGALNMDKLFKVNKIAKAEEESFVASFQETCGGSAANTIVGLARLQCDVGFIGKVADDREGRLLLEDFRKENVNTDSVIIAKQGRSGTVMGFVDEEGQRALYVDPGVNNEISFEEIDLSYASQAKFIHLTSFVGEETFQAQKKLLEKLPKNVRVSFDPGSIYSSKGMRVLEPLIRKTYVLMPNATELELLSGKTDYCKGAELMIEKGIKIVAVKLGSRGCYVTDGKENILINAFKAKAVDTTGAGDAFCAGFLYGLIKGNDLYTCGRIGNFVASRCVMRMGARASLPRQADLAFLG